MGYLGGGPPSPHILRKVFETDTLCSDLLSEAGTCSDQMGVAGERFCQPFVASVLMLDSAVHLHPDDAAIGVDVDRA
jgi:hypothetical protein